MLDRLIRLIGQKCENLHTLSRLAHATDAQREEAYRYAMRACPTLLRHHKRQGRA